MARRFENTALFIKTGNPQTVSETTPFIAGQLGQYVTNNLGLDIPSGTVKFGAGGFPRVWQYVKLSASSATPAFGQCLVWLDTTDLVVTTASSTSKQNQPAGVLTSASAVLGDYIFILVKGVAPILVENGLTPAAGDSVNVGATTAGRWGVIAEGTASVTAGGCGFIIGTKTTAYNGSSVLPTDTCAAFINIPAVS